MKRTKKENKRQSTWTYNIIIRALMYMQRQELSENDIKEIDAGVMKPE